MGITGKNVRVAVIDDGLERSHEDLISNYDPEISHDYTVKDLKGLPDPTPNSFSQMHGTRCAGEIAMTANNKKCGVGLAYGSNIGGIKVLGKYITDISEAQALKHNHHLVDIYSASWGPTDDGQTVEGAGRMSAEAMKRAIEEVRSQSYEPTTLVLSQTC